MTNTVDNLIKAMIASAREIPENLHRGNDKSKRMGRIMSICLDVLEKSQPRFEKMWEELRDVYIEMSSFHNKIYRDFGGKMGSGEFLSLDIEDADSKTDFKLRKIYEGVDADGFMKLQFSIPMIEKLGTDIRDMFPVDTPYSSFINHIKMIYWITIMCVYEKKHRDKVIKIINKYDPKNS
ncbi:MAG: hypothetical protein EBS19_02380 [Spirochaetia bacterium]|nr:hypothetical protein [Spirochaetia bacterium]